MKVLIRQGSLTDGDETVLVNASNTNAVLGSGVSAAIKQACGKGYQEQVLVALGHHFKGPMQPGQVLLTHAGTHPRASWVAHVAVMDYREGHTPNSAPTVETIRAGYQRLWEVVEAIPRGGAQSVALVALGAGTGNLGVAVSTRVGAETLKAFIALHPNTHIERVTFYGFQLPDYIAVAHVLAEAFPEVKPQLPPEVLRFIEEGA